MLTMTLIDDLASDLRPVIPRRGTSTLLPGLLGGAFLSFAAVAGSLGVQPGLATLAHGAPLAMKLSYTGALAAIAFGALGALAVPGRRPVSWRWAALPAAILAALAFYQLGGGIGQSATSQILGSTWFLCPARIAAFSLPLAAGLTMMVRRLAPTNLRRAGAAIGLTSGALAAAIYALACAENSAAFVLIWYSLGIGATTLAGALAGPRLLRW